MTSEHAVELTGVTGPNLIDGHIHLGHWLNFCAADAAARARRAEGIAVQSGIWVDAYAGGNWRRGAAHGTLPAARMQEALLFAAISAMGHDARSAAAISVLEGSFHRDVQALFLSLHEAGLAYEGEAITPWCPNCDRMIPWEAAIDLSLRRNTFTRGRCSSCKGSVEPRPHRGKFLHQARYATELSNLAPGSSWPEAVLERQRLWLSGNERRHDWAIDRPGHWGVAVPILECGHCGHVPLAPEALPLMIDSGDGATRLSTRSCPRCEGTDVKDARVFDATFVFAVSPLLAARRALVDLPSKTLVALRSYVACAKQAVTQLLYCRLLVRALRDAGWSAPAEPFRTVHCGGELRGLDGEKLPVGLAAELHERHGADVVRLALLAMLPFERGGIWQEHYACEAASIAARLARLATRPCGREEDGVLRERARVVFRETHEALTEFQFHRAWPAVEGLLVELESLASRGARPPGVLELLIDAIAPVCPELCGRLSSRRSG